MNEGDAGQMIDPASDADEHASCGRCSRQLDHYKLVRDAIVHEDNLVNHRLTWLLSGHAFLFAAFGVIQNTVLRDEVSVCLTFILEFVVLCTFCVAAATARTIGVMIAIASAHNSHLAAWWQKKYPREQRQRIPVHSASLVAIENCPDPDHNLTTEFPHVRGDFTGVRSITWLPTVFMIGDIVLILACIGIAAYVYVHGKPSRPDEQGGRSEQNVSATDGSAPVGSSTKSAETFEEEAGQPRRRQPLRAIVWPRR